MVVIKEMYYFKGLYIYIYDMEEKMKLVMVCEYVKVVDKKDGEWLQFCVVFVGWCLFVQDYEILEKENCEKMKIKECVVKVVVVENVVKFQFLEVLVFKFVIGKWIFVVMEDG